MTRSSLRRRLGALTLMIASVLGAAPLWAVTVTVDFVASDVQGAGDNPTREAEFFALLGLSPGGTVTGRITFDSSFPENQFQYSNNFGIYFQGRSVSAASFSITIGGTTYTPSTVGAISEDIVQQFEPTAQDQFNISGPGFFDAIPGAGLSGAGLVVREPDLDRFDGLFRDASVLEAMSDKRLFLGLFSPVSPAELVSTQIVFSSPAIIPVPLPAVLLLTGLGALAVVRRRAMA